MRVVRTIAEVGAALRERSAGGHAVGLVPTMGALHAGHISLARAARVQCDVVAATIFVNPTQFGPNEDFGQYPRTFDEDCAQLEREHVDLLFAPPVEEMYPAAASTFVEVEGLSDRLDGASRPGHFRGVATVVAKLFHIVGPDKAFFGQKDAAQVAVLRRMVRDLHFPVELVVCPIVREPDGLALSSRNRYLSPAEREQAPVLHRTLLKMEEEIALGVRDASALIRSGGAVFGAAADGAGSSVRLDYLKAVDPDTLEEVADIRAGALIAMAAYVGRTRLIDNFLVPPLA
jgi:pantoate--beta-alanine ligase